MSPLLILAVGVSVVLGMIIWLRVNAFIALITAAMVVSLLAPGEVGIRISRVAQAFGRSAGAIGIVIALAAVIGQCMMESGAADRIVRAFLKLLGEKRAPAALMGSGFVLAVPVFFDTVFYLLVPLARSLYRRTGRHYLLYIMAISAGGAITHTLVPPTPGPLLMASTLGIDVGLMILVGGLIAIPAAIAGMIFSIVIDRVMDVPMRAAPAASESDGGDPDDERLPSLPAALLPILLPVALISCNTIVETLADARRPGQLREDDVIDWTVLAEGLQKVPAGKPIRERLRELGIAEVPTSDSDADSREAFVDAVNRLLADRELYPRTLPKDPSRQADWFAVRRAFSASIPSEQEADEAVISDGAVRPDIRAAYEFHRLHASIGSRTRPVVIEHMNRLLLEAMFPDAVRPHEWNTPLRRLSRFTALIGNANLALLLAMASALLVYVRHRRPPAATVAASVEAALMSGGAIILITAAGGAFGAMLDVAGVGPAVQNLFSTQGSGEGMFYLFLGFGMAALLKVAQGSSTTAMIVVSGMLAPVVADVTLPWNVVYLATAIGAGSLAGSWMNDSGFWIVARMSGLTESEALKTWTPLLLVLSVVSLLATLGLATVFPLVARETVAVIRFH